MKRSRSAKAKHEGTVAPGRVGANRHDARVGVRTSREGGMQHAGQLDVVDEAAFAAQEAWIFPPWHRRAEVLGSHRSAQPPRYAFLTWSLS